MPKIGEVTVGHEVGLKTRNKLVWSACIGCGKERWVSLIKGGPSYLHCKACGDKGKRGELSPHWKGGRRIHDGYVKVYLSPEDFFYPMAQGEGCVLEHRLVMARQLGRCLQSWEIVHHKNGIRDDNRNKNLQLGGSMGEHIRDHSKGYRDGYQKGLIDGRNKQVEELKTLIEEQTKQIKLLQWQGIEFTRMVR